MLKKIDSYEFSSLFILTFLSSSIGLSLFTTIKYASVDSYIGIAISTIIGLIPLLIFIYIFNYEKELNIKDKINSLFGKILGTIINYLLVILFVIIIITLIFNLSNFIVSQYLSDTNILYIMIILGITIYFTLNKGIETISRISSIFLVILFLLFIIAVFSLKKEIQLDNLKPILEYGLKGPIKAGLINSLITTIPCFSLLMVPRNNVTNKSSLIKYLVISYLISSIALFLISFISSTILGKYLLEIYQYPAYISLKKASLFNFLNRIENFFSLGWILSSFIAITSSLYYVKENIIKKNTIINIILVTLSIILSYKLFKNNTIFDNYIIKYYPYILLSILIIFSLIMVTILIKNSIKRKT